MSTLVIITEVSPDTANQTLDVHDNGRHVIPVGAEFESAEIIWKLTDPAATFNAISDPTNPGFSWAGTTPPHFGDPTLDPTSRAISLFDNHTGELTKGTFIYKLCAMIDGTLYSTSVSLPSGTTHNPGIKNN